MIKFPKELAEIILGYSLEWQLRPDVDDRIKYTYGSISKVYAIDRLSLNPHGVDFLDKHPELICWRLIAANPSANHLTFSDHTTRRFKATKRGDRAGRGVRPVFLNGQRYYVNIAMLCRNSSETAIAVLKTLPEERLAWDTLSGNTHPWAVSIVNRNPSKIRHDSWLSNPSAIDHISLPDKQSVRAHSANPHPIMVAHLLAHPELIKVNGMLRNPMLVDIYLDTKKWNEFASSPFVQAEIKGFGSIARNPNPKAIEYCLQGRHAHWSWSNFIANPGIFTLVEPDGLRKLLGI
jgi:hypothetical protein